MAKKKNAGPWQSRIVGEGFEAPDQLLANPKNWRVHPKEQQDGLAAVLDKVGWVQRVVVNKRTGHLVDGHLRVTLAMRREEPKIPVLYVDLTPKEEALVLATIDPISGMAGTDPDQLKALLGEVGPTDDPELDALLKQIGEDVPGIAALGLEPDLPKSKKPSLSFNLIFDTPGQQARWFEFMQALEHTFRGETIGGKLDAFLEATSSHWRG